MKEILILGPNKYKEWLTYAIEYLYEAFIVEPSVNVKAWGRYREGYIPGLSLKEAIEHMYGTRQPDAIIMNIGILNSDDNDDKLIVKGLEELSKDIILIFRCDDPWRFLTKIVEIYERIQPHYILVVSSLFVDLFNEKLKGTKTKTYMVPCDAGRRYFNMAIDRKYDLGLIGRCHNNDTDISSWKLKLHLKVFEEGNLGVVRRSVGREHYLNRYSTLVLNLNHCLTSWNSPVVPKGMEKGNYSTPLRFVEAPSCGAVMVCPFDYPELNEYYYPKKAYINCESNLNTAIKQIKYLRKNTEAFLELQNLAYRYVMANHQTKNRVDFYLDLINGNSDTDARNYYKMPLNE
jgi:hypothetical protein